MPFCLKTSGTTKGNLYELKKLQDCPVCVLKGNPVVLSVSKYKKFTVVVKA